MNLFGSYRNLRDNAIAATVAAIEIYNKPKMDYRSECFIILMANAWELLLKAILSKNKVRLYEPKKKGEKYRSITLYAAMKACEPYFPATVQFRPVAENIDAISILRNNAIHFYNEKDFQVLIYGLAQTSIVNFRDVTSILFGRDISDEITLALLPLSFASPPDPIQFLKKGGAAKSPEVAEFIEMIATRTRELEAQKLDTGRFLTVFTISLQSSKKILSADITASLGGATSEAIILNRPVDPNKSHPLLRMRVLEQLGPVVNGVKFTPHTFESIAWTAKIKENPRYCWKPMEGGTNHYAQEVVSFIKTLSAAEIGNCVAKYTANIKHLQAGKRGQVSKT